MKAIHQSLALAGLLIVSTTVRAQFADAVISYNPGSGFAAGYTNASSALGAPALGSSINPMDPPFTKTQLVSIGAGGEITLQLDMPIMDNASDPYGLDFIIFANSFFVANGGSGQNETTSGSLYYHPASILVQVSADDLNWFTLNSSLAPQPGEWFPSYGGGNPLIPVDPSLATTDFAGMTLGQIESLYAGSAGGTGYDLAWAQDSDNNNANLTSADYVRLEVQSGVLDMDAISVVPEPSAGVLAVLGAGLFFLRRKF
ncbi:MAG TPA: PEP-CTERM sorting domain-containing protein [Candidatus Saccharimonadales bacterium]|nr:PEP-CTERM sorting domain-containing protein [Candidatus Saccharimonadales bacterium]